MSTHSKDQTMVPGGFRTRHLLAIFLLLTVLTGCANGNAMLISGKDTAALPANATIHRIYVATTRERDPDPAIMFNGERQTGLSFAAIDVSVPPIHEIGKTERPSRGSFDPSRHFMARRVVQLDNEQALTSVLSPTSKDGGEEVMIFIHGYRNNFSDALFRITQIVHDTGFTGKAVLFSWASRGRTVDYIYDRDSATAGRDALEATLHAIARAKPQRIDVIAHSMGGWVTMEALRQLKIGNDADLGGRLGNVILASPDISADVFKGQMLRYGKPAKPFFVLLSRDDRALQVSQLIAGNKPRLGGYTNDREIADLGVIVVDLTDAADGDSLNHAKFAQNPALVQMLGQRLRSGESFNPERANLGDNLLTLGSGVGTVLESTAKVIITTPKAVFQTAIPQ